MRIIPVPDVLTAPYWAAAAEHRLVVQRCGCGRLSHPPVARCPECHGATFTWPQMSGRGTVHAFTWVAHSVHPATEGHTPYVIALVALAEGPRILTNLLHCRPEEAHVGMPVQVVFQDLTEDLSLPQFVPVEQGAGP